MKRFFIFVFLFLLTFSLLRACLGTQPLTFSGFFSALSKLDFDFSNLKSIINYMRDLSFSLSSDSGFFEYIVAFFKALVSPILLLCGIVADIGNLLYSVLSVLLNLIGVDIFR